MIATESMEAKTKNDRRAYMWAALFFVAIAVTGFARTYFLKTLFANSPLPFALHVHGVIMSSWLTLFFVQTYLVAGGRIAVHRRLGVVGAGLALLVIIISAYVTIDATAREVHRHVVRQFHFLFGFNLVNLMVFAGLFIAALGFRGRPEFHKRLMLLSTVSLLPPAVARVTLLFGHSDIGQMLTYDLFVLAVVVADTIRHRRLHPASGWGGLVILGVLNASFFAFQTDQWTNLVTRLFS